jgi:hypothetical protein
MRTQPLKVLSGFAFERDGSPMDRHGGPYPPNVGPASSDSQSGCVPMCRHVSRLT